MYFYCAYCYYCIGLPLCSRTFGVQAESSSMALLVVLLVNAVLCSVPALSYEPEEQVYLAQDPNHPDKSMIVAITWTDKEGSMCEVYSDVNLLEVIRNIPKDQVLRRIEWNQVHELLNKCTTLHIRNGPQPPEDMDKTLTTPAPESENDGWVIFPGTKWCGAGDRAKNYDDLGIHQDTDRCCRTHDKCSDLIEGGGSKYNLTNSSPFTKLNCECDDEFYNCLSRVNSVTSNTIGNTYFNVLRRPCYYYDYPTSKECKKYTTFLKLTCLEYKRDTKAKKVWQWRDPKLYKRLPVPLPIDINLPF